MISASALAPNCGFARILSAKRPRPPSTVEAAARGTVFHSAVETWIKDGEFPAVDDLEMQGWLDLLASQWTPPAHAEVEVAWGLRPDGSYTEVDEPSPHVYVARDGGELLTAGRADLAFERAGVLHVVDWKTGRWAAAPAVANLQVHAAGLALAERTGLHAYLPMVYYVRDGYQDFGDVVPLGSPLRAEMFERVREAATLPPEPRPGPWCARCWERRDCPDPF